MSLSEEELLCRVCMRNCNGHNIPLLDVYPVQKEHLVINYLTAFNKCTRLQAQPGEDGLPEWLCANCERDLQISYEFCCRARDADAKLRSRLKMCKQQEEQQQQPPQREGEVKRAATPSEFELPEGNGGADGYLKYGTDQLGDTCVFDEAVYAKDPLEDTDSEDDLKLMSDLPALGRCITPVVAPSTDSYDSEDDKPLKQLFLPKSPTDALATSPVLPKTEVVDNFKAPKPQEALITHDNTINRNLYDDDDEFIGADEHSKAQITDAAFSAEAQIFPKGHFKCDICAKPYFTPVGLKSHLEVHLPKSITAKKKRVRRKPAQLKMDTDEHTADLDALQRTSTLIGETESPSIDVPKAAIKTRKKQQPKPKKMFPCHVCGKHMISASKLRYHMVMHTGEKDYLCTMCPKAYSTIYALKHHIRTHTGERPYECKFCGDKFLRPTTLKSHQRRHTGERPYGCDVCGKRFIQHSSMTTHMRLNHMEKTIKCPHCDKKYARQTDLNTHLLSHTGDKPYPCQLCPSRFVRQANLNKHMNQQHSSKALGTITPANACQARRANATLIVEHFVEDDVEATNTLEDEMESCAGTTSSQLSGDNVLSASIKNELHAGLRSDFEYAQPADSSLDQEKVASVTFNSVVEDRHLQASGTDMESMCVTHDLARWHWPDN